MQMKKVPTWFVRASTTPAGPGGHGDISVTLLNGAQFREQVLGWAKLSAGNRFEFCGLGPTSYSVTIQQLSGQETKVFGEQTFLVGNRDLDLGQIPLSQTQTIAGRVEFATDGEKSNIEKRIYVLLEPLIHLRAHGECVQSEIDTSTGDFSISNVPMDSYRVQISRPPKGAYVKAASVGNRDVLREPLTPGIGDLRVLLGTDGASISGKVISTEGAPVADAAVLIIAKDPVMLADTGGIRFQETDQNGEFSFYCLV